MSNQPDYCYDPDNWETTFPWSDRVELMLEDLIDPGEFKEIACLKQVPSWFAVHVVVSRDEDGDPDETEIQWFNNIEDARRATGK